MPDFIKDIVVVNNVAFVAAGSAGLYAVDVSNPAAPLIVGFFDTDVYSAALAVAGGIAYVADGSGLQVI